MNTGEGSDYVFRASESRGGRQLHVCENLLGLTCLEGLLKTAGRRNVGQMCVEKHMRPVRVCDGLAMVELAMVWGSCVPCAACEKVTPGCT